MCKCFAVLCPPPKQQTAVLSRVGRSLKRFQYNTTERTARNKLPRIRIHVIVTGVDVVTPIVMNCCRKENMKSGLRSSGKRRRCCLIFKGRKLQWVETRPVAPSVWTSGRILSRLSNDVTSHPRRMETPTAPLRQSKDSHHHRHQHHHCVSLRYYYY